ncbi:MAG TPA: sporangiospore maturation cell wall hydrolase GsmA [Pilimelia sp.]|nr:sporangiospore maturation cell wall hydrolase GsmA [Pilimelia sp.]
MWRTRWVLTAACAGISLVAGVGGPAFGAGATATAHTGGIPLNVRGGASTGHPRVGVVPDGRRLTVVCQVRGQDIRGYARRTALWDRLADGRYVSDANVAWRPARPALRWCGSARARGRATATVSTGGIPLNVRAGASSGNSRLRTVPNGARLALTCRVIGQPVAGHVRRSVLWDRLAGGGYVADAYVAWRPARPNLPWCAGAPTRPPRLVATTPAGFIAAVARPARASMRRHGVPASVTIAQAILESGWGRSRLAYADQNYFGIKCFGSPGPVAVGCRAYGTSECAGSRCYQTRATFRVYRGLADSVRDHGRFLAVDNPRYRPAFVYSRAPERFTIAIHRAGYATSPRYAGAIIALMREYNLYRYNN